MSIDKYIYWRDASYPPKDGKRFANVHLLVGYNDCSIQAYKGMAVELRKTFPQAKDTDLICGKVTASGHLQGHTLLAFTAWIEDKKYDGWHDTLDRCDYTWS